MSAFQTDNSLPEGETKVEVQMDDSLPEGKAKVDALEYGSDDNLQEDSCVYPQEETDPGYVTSNNSLVLAHDEHLNPPTPIKIKTTYSIHIYDQLSFKDLCGRQLPDKQLLIIYRLQLKIYSKYQDYSP